jgi:hypothetical protein
MMNIKRTFWGRIEKDERLEKLSEKVRMGEPIEVSEAVEVIEYQQRMRQLMLKRKQSFISKVLRFLGIRD